MFKSHFISVLRSLWKNKLGTIIMIISIGVAISACLLLFQYSNFYLSFDKFNKKADRIYRIPYKKTTDGSLEVDCPENVSNLAPWLKENFPEVEEVVRMVPMADDHIFTYTDKQGNHRAIENRLVYVDTNFCKIFPLEFVYGNCETAFKRRMTVVLSQSFSEKLFGKENPLGKEIKMSPGEDYPYEIVGVYKDFPVNSHIKSDILMSFKQVENLMLGQTWMVICTNTYILLKENASVEDFQHKIDKSLKGELKKYLTECILEHYPDSKNYEEQITKHNFQYEFKLQPLSSLNFKFKQGEIQYRMILFMFAISIFILIIAWINNFNLAGVKMLENTATTQIRKVIGANNKQIFLLFLIESIFINLIGVFLALIIYRSIFPYFIQLSKLPTDLVPFMFFFNGYSNQYFFSIIISLLLMTGLSVPLILPFYKFLIQTRYFSVGSSLPYRNTRSGIKSTMVVIQFVFSIFMIASVITIFKQMNYMNKKELGFNPDQIFVIRAPIWINEAYFKNFKPFSDEIERNPIITEVIEATSVPPMEMMGTGAVSYTHLDVYKRQIYN